MKCSLGFSSQALRVTYTAIRERLAAIDEQSKPLIEAAGADLWLDYGNAAPAAREQLAKLNIQVETLQRDARYARGAMMVAQHEFDTFLTRWAKSVYVEHSQPASACFSGTARDVGRLGELFELRKRAHLTVAGHMVAAPADARVISASSQRRALAVIGGDLGGEMPSLPDAWEAPALPAMSPQLAAHIDKLRLAHAASVAALARICMHDNEPRRPSRDRKLAALQAEADRARASRDHLKNELEDLHSEWRLDVGQVLAAATVELAGDMGDSYGSACVGLRMIEVLHRLALKHSLMWAKRFPSGPPGLHAARDLVRLLEGGDAGSVKLLAAARQAAATPASQMVAASTEAARVDRLTRQQIDKYPDYSDEQIETERLATARGRVVVRRRSDFE